jgi:hypothetical protein
MVSKNWRIVFEQVSYGASHGKVCHHSIRGPIADQHTWKM